MESLIHKYGLEDLIYLKDLVSQDELVYIYNSLDMFIFPTYRKSDSLGLVGLEAMSCEVPTIVANNYGPSTYIINNENGFFFESTNVDSLVEVIKKVKGMNKKELNKITSNGRKTSISYSNENTKSVLRKVFK